MESIELYKDNLGRLKAKIGNQATECQIKPVRCFPITAPQSFIGLFKTDSDGTMKEEVLLISDYDQFDGKTRALLEDELNSSYPLLRIKKIHSIRQIDTRLKWHVSTNGGQLSFYIKNQKDIYNIKPSLVVITDIQGRKFVLNPKELDLRSETLLEVYI